MSDTLKTFENAISDIESKISVIEEELFGLISQKKTVEDSLSKLIIEIENKRVSLKEWRSVALKLKSELS